MYGGRPQEAAGLLTLAVQVAQQNGLDHSQYRAHSNLANLGMNWDLPGAATHAEAALAAYRRRGDPYAESLAGSVLARLHLMAGRWDQLADLCAEAFEDPERPGAEFGHYARLLLHAHRGEAEEAIHALAQLTAWRDTDDVEFDEMYHACAIATNLVQGDPAAALDTALRIIPDAIRILTPAIEGVRDAWPDAVQAALALGRHDEVHSLIALLTDRPRGHVPPYLRAQLAPRTLAWPPPRDDTKPSSRASMTRSRSSRPWAIPTGSRSPRPTSPRG
jgi:hypothetical protein